MADPHVPETGTGRGATLDLPCGETLDAADDVDMGMREIDCACGDRHAVVMDVHPPSRFLPESTVAVLREVVETADADEMGDFGTPHLMGMVMEEFPEEVAVADVAEEGRAGYALVWATDFDARHLHELLVELVVEMMEHAVGHVDDEEARGEFETQMFEFDVAAFVEQYRRERDFEDERDAAI